MVLDDGDARQITHHEKTSGAAGFPRWSPDGSAIAFGDIAGGPSAIYWVAIGHDDLHRVTTPHFDTYPDWSPDGRWIAFRRGINGSQLFAIRPDGTGLTQLTYGPGNKELPRWRPT